MTTKTKNKLDKWVTEHYKWLRKEISKNICNGKMRQYTDDMMSHMVESLYALSDEKVNQMIDDEKLKWWFLRGASLQIRSSSSPFYFRYRKHKMSARENGLEGSSKNIFDGVYEEYNDDLYECFEAEYNNLHWYLQTIMSRYWYEGWSIPKLHKHYNISKRHLVKDLNTAINQIRTKCNQC